MAACSPANDLAGEDAVDSSCEGAASHVGEVCAELMGDAAELFAEEFRVDCIAMQGFYAAEARCAARSKTCQEVLECEIASVSFVCETATDCGGDLFCESDLSDCVACLEDSHCTEGKSCLAGLCIGDGNSLHE